MFINRNYIWMLDWHKPHFSFGGAESVYYLFLYHKLMNQGTQEDKLRLLELHKQSKARSDGNPSLASAIFKFFSLAEHDQYACEKFIYEKKIEHFDDDIERARQVSRIDSERKIKAIQKRMFGYDPAEKKMNEEIFETKLDLSHTPEQKKFIVDDKGYNVHPPLEKVKQQQLLHSEEVVVKRIDKNVTIHCRIYDMCDGFYTTLVWADNAPMINGVQQVNGGYSALYAGPVGIVKVMENNLFQVKLDVQCHRYETNMTESKAKKKSEPRIDIDKINKALGIDNTDDDLNGDVF